MANVVFLLAAGAAGSIIALAPVANADTNPLVPYGPNPIVPTLGVHADNHDDVDTTNGFNDTPF